MKPGGVIKDLIALPTDISFGDLIQPLAAPLPQVVLFGRQVTALAANSALLNIVAAFLLLAAYAELTTTAPNPKVPGRSYPPATSRRLKGLNRQDQTVPSTYPTAATVAETATSNQTPYTPTGTVSVSKPLRITILLQAVSVWTRTTRQGSSHMIAAKLSAKRKPSWSPWLPTEQEGPLPRVALSRYLHQAPLPRARLKPATTAFRMVNQNRARRVVRPGLARLFRRRLGDVKGAHLPPRLTTNVHVSRSLAARSTIRFSNSPSMFGKIGPRVRGNFNEIIYLGSWLARLFTLCHHIPIITFLPSQCLGPLYHLLLSSPHPLTPPTASSTTKLARPSNFLIPPARPIAAINKAQTSKHESLTQSTTLLQATLQSPHKTLDINTSTPHESLSILTVAQRLLPRPTKKGVGSARQALHDPSPSGTIPHDFFN